MLINKTSAPRVLTVTALLLLVRPAIASPDFTGIWMRDPKASDQFTAVAEPIISPKWSLPGENYILHINHHNKHLHIAAEQGGKRPMVIDYKLRRGRHGDTGYEFGGTEYSCRWNGDILSIEKHVFYRGYTEGTGGTMRQDWTLSPDGKTLTVTTIKTQRASGWGDSGENNRLPITIKEIFRRK